MKYRYHLIMTGTDDSGEKVLWKGATPEKALEFIQGELMGYTIANPCYNGWDWNYGTLLLHGLSDEGEWVEFFRLEAIGIHDTQIRWDIGEEQLLEWVMNDG